MKLLLDTHALLWFCEGNASSRDTRCRKIKVPAVTPVRCDPDVRQTISRLPFFFAF